MALLITDAVDIAVDPLTGDIAIGTNGGPYLSKGIPGIVQAVRIALLMFQGEWFLNLDAGMPWYQSILGAKWTKATQVVARAAITNAILSVNGVTKIASLSLTWNSAARKLAITWSAVCQFGTTPVDTLLLPNGPGGTPGGVGGSSLS